MKNGFVPHAYSHREEYEHFHCYYEDIGIPDVTATSAIEKFTKYIFNDTIDDGKKELFERWGYTFIDSSALQKEFEKQARLSYQCGDYVLGKRTGHGQRINVVMHLKRKNSGQEVTFDTGWMVYPDGKLLLITPYGGK